MMKTSKIEKFSYLICFFTVGKKTKINLGDTLAILEARVSSVAH